MPRVPAQCVPSAGRRRAFRLGVLAALLLVSGCSVDESYPNRPITLICPWSVGGGTDRVSRQMAVFLEKELGVPVNVVNATGGQGVTGHHRALAADPDGYTVGMMTLELSVLHWRGLTGMSWKDCIPLVSLNEDPAALFVKEDAPWRTLAELEEAIRAEPGTIQASGTAALGAWHLAIAGWLISLDLPPNAVTWIPQGGAGPSLQEMMSGGLDVVCCSLPEALSLYEQGEIRCLGVMAERRVASPTFQDIPTLKEQGSDWSLVGWRGLGVAPGTPEPIVEALKAAAVRIVTGETQVNGETFPEFMERQEFDHTFRVGDEFRDFLDETDQKFGAILQRKDFATVSSGPIGAMDFPYLLFGLLAVVLAGLSLSWLRRPADAAPRPGLLGDPRQLVNPALVILAISAYIALADEVGFLITAALLLVLLLWKLGTRLTVSLAITVVVVPALYQLFNGLLRVPLPRGWMGW